jgi:UDP:flavonoid glycosyltransferase YjiC (YdhE family)
MRVLAVPVPATTHLAALVPACRALRTAGHDVLVACQPDLVPAVRAAGLIAAEVGTEADLTTGIGRFLPESMFPAHDFARRDTMMGRSLWEALAHSFAVHAEEYVEDYLRLARAWCPDVLLHDHLSLIGRVLGGVLGVPAVSHRWGLDPTNGPCEAKAREYLAPLCDRLGLPGLPEPGFIVDPCPPSLQVEDALPGYRVRYVPFNGTGTLPDWARGRPARRRVCVCMGSTVTSLMGPDLILHVVDALSGLDVEVVVAMTPRDRETVGELPADVRVVESLPLDLFLATCDLLVCVGGSGTGLTATAFGLPQLVLPQWTDNFDYGRRLADAGAGITIADAAGQYDVEGLRAAAAGLLDDPGYTEAARRLRAEIEAAPSPHALVRALEDLTRPAAAPDTPSTPRQQHVPHRLES